MTKELFQRGHEDVCRDAMLSDCLRYRWQLKRWWGEGDFVCWIMLNPSTADAAKDDPTIRRCISFSRDWGFSGLYVVNLYGLRATNPHELETSFDPLGKENDWAIQNAISECKSVVAAWGAHPMARRRAAVVSRWAKMQCLGRTKDGFPRHPLYVAGNTNLIPF